MGQFTKDMQLYRAALSKSMEMAAIYDLPIWSKMMGFVGSQSGAYDTNFAYGAKSKSQKFSPTGKPIEVLTDFQHEGGVTMDIPVAYPITELPVYGDKQALGTGEKRKLAYKKLQINQVRKVVNVRDGKMSEMVLKKDAIRKELMDSAKRELTDYFVRYNSYQPYAALFQRYSHNLIDSPVNGGLGLTPQSHPNFFVATAGKVSWSDTPATYETAVSTALATLTDTAADYFSTDLIDNAVFTASSLKIQPIMFGKDGAPFYAMIINPAQAKQLRKDTKWLDAQKNAAPRDETVNKLFQGFVEGFYGGAFIIVDQNIPGARISGDSGYDATRGTVNYGNANFLANPLDTSNRKLGVLVGKSAIACGMADPLHFESEEYDFKNRVDDAGIQTLGFERGDIYDTDGYFGTAGKFLENTSSLVFATYSPSATTW